MRYSLRICVPLVVLIVLVSSAATATRATNDSLYGIGVRGIWEVLWRVRGRAGARRIQVAALSWNTKACRRVQKGHALLKGKEQFKPRYGSTEHSVWTYELKSKGCLLVMRVRQPGRSQLWIDDSQCKSKFEGGRCSFGMSDGLHPLPRRHSAWRRIRKVR